MAIESPLGSLCKVLKQLRDSASRHEEVLKRSEAATRATLVDPLLRALGWDITDVTMVEVEKTKGEFRADYVLLDSQSNIKAIIEAKALGETLTDHKTVVKLFSYAANFHCNSVFITDGRHWHHYTEMNIMDTTPSRVLKINNDDLIDVAAYFVQRIDASWYRNQVVSDDPTMQLRQLQQQLNEMAVELKVLKHDIKMPSTEEIKVVCAPPTPEKYVATQGCVPLEHLGVVRGTSITKCYLNEKEVPVKSWKDLLEGIVREVLVANPTLELPLKDAAGKKIYLLSLTPPIEGRGFKEMIYNGRRVYLYTHYSADSIVSNTKYMLQYLPENQRKVEVQVAE